MKQQPPMAAFYSPVDTVDAPAMFTPWSLVHATAGVLIQAVLLLFVPSPTLAVSIAFVVHLLYETFDYLGSYTTWFKPYHDAVYKFFGLEETDTVLFSNSALNSVGDIISFMSGQIVAWQLVVRDGMRKTAVFVPLLLLVAWFSASSITMTLD